LAQINFTKVVKDHKFWNVRRFLQVQPNGSPNVT